MSKSLNDEIKEALPQEAPTLAIRFRARILFEQAAERGKVKNLHQLATRARLSYPTVHSWTRQPTVATDKVQLSKVFLFLTDGLGFTPAELREMKVADLFDVPDNIQETPA